MAKGVFQFIANRIFDCVGNCKVITCNLIIKKLRTHLSLDCDVIECTKEYILFQADLCGDKVIYKAVINERNCIEYVEIYQIVE